MIPVYYNFISLSVFNMSAKQPLYKKKGETQEETKGEAPTRGYQGRGSYRGARGGNRGGEGGDRPRTAVAGGTPATADGQGNQRGGDRRPYYQRRKDH